MSPPRVELLRVTATKVGSSSCCASAPAAARAVNRMEVYIIVVVAVVEDMKVLWLKFRGVVVVLMPC